MYRDGVCVPWCDLGDRRVAAGDRRVAADVHSRSVCSCHVPGGAVSIVRPPLVPGNMGVGERCEHELRVELANRCTIGITAQQQPWPNGEAISLVGLIWMLGQSFAV